MLFLAILSCSSALYAKKAKKPKTSNTTTTFSAKEKLELEKLFITGEQAYLLGNTQDAVVKFNEVIRRDSKNDAAYFQLARIAFESRNMDKCIEFAQTAININPTNEYYYQYLAEAYGEKKNFTEAYKQ